MSTGIQGYCFILYFSGEQGCGCGGFLFRNFTKEKKGKKEISSLGHQDAYVSVELKTRNPSAYCNRCFQSTM
jgi:hypothetical protein